MEIISVIIQSLATFLGFLTALLSVLLFVQLHWPAPALWFFKLYASALSPLFVFIGVFCTLVGLLAGSVLIALIGIYIILVFSIHIFRVTRPPAALSDFEKIFGTHSEEKISHGLRGSFLRGRTVFILPEVPDPSIEQDISFTTIPGSDRKLLCDIWQPAENVTRSELALIYLHGGTWFLLDKDVGTRSFFRHLAAQGHVIMDVAYRLAPETDMTGMLNDIKRAITWLRAKADSYRVNPRRIVVSGGAAGGHLALLAAYTANNPEFTPKELEGEDTSVRGVISLYGPADLKAMYYHTNQHLTTRSTPGELKKAVPAQLPGWIIKIMGKEYYRLNIDKGFKNAGSFAPLLGGHPDECPETYALFSPVTHIHSNCPPTLLIHGEHDVMAPVKTTRYLYARLAEKKIKTVLHTLPQTDHGFDLQLPKISPSAHNAFFDVERFLALMD